MTGLILMRGYPGSGKSTTAKTIAREFNAVIVNRDSLRHMAYDTYYGPTVDERIISKIEHAAVNAVLKSGNTVILDNTNLNPAVVEGWDVVANNYHGLVFHVYDVTTPVEECIIRDRERGRAGGRWVGEEVIRRMAEQYPVEEWINYE